MCHYPYMRDIYTGMWDEKGDTAWGTTLAFGKVGGFTEDLTLSSSYLPAFKHSFRLNLRRSPPTGVRSHIADG